MPSRLPHRVTMVCQAEDQTEKKGTHFKKHVLQMTYAEAVCVAFHHLQSSYSGINFYLHAEKNGAENQNCVCSSLIQFMLGKIQGVERVFRMFTRNTHSC